MNNLKLNVTIPSLSLLTPIGTNTYQVVVRFFNSTTGAPLGNPNIPNSYTATIVTTVPNFDINVPITDATWTANNVNVKVYANNTTNCCVATDNYESIINTLSGTPDPEARFEFIMGTTGGGFDPSSPTGIGSSWQERLEAFEYGWGWGVTGLCIWVPWEIYEPTPGVYRTADFQKVIDYCNARELGLSVAFGARRTEGDGFLNADEIVKGSMGTTYIEGVPGFGAIYPSYGCDRTNELMYGAIQSLATQLNSYSRAFYMTLYGGHTGELVNHVIVESGVWQCGDFCDDNLDRFNDWCTTRGLASPGAPPMIQGPGIPWPHPDFTQERGKEFSRFMSYNLHKYYNNFCDAVKSVTDLPCIYIYAAPSNLQLRCTDNANMNYIAAPGEGMYGSFGDGVFDQIAKVDVNSVNMGTFPDGISCVEFDPDDLSEWRSNNGGTPPYCGANPQYNVFQSSAANLYNKGVRVIHTAMAFCPTEIVAWGPVLQTLWGTHIGKPYVRPNITPGNTVNCEVTTPYRASQDILSYYGVDVNTKYAKYTDNDFWGGVLPPDDNAPPPFDGTAITNYMNTNLGEYGGNVLLNIRNNAGTDIYSYTQGSYNRTTDLGVASLSKSVSAVVLLTLIQDGILSLNTTVGSLIPSWNKDDTLGHHMSGITLRQILSHTSGMKDDTSSALDGSANLEVYADDYAEWDLEFAPGSNFAYRTSSYNIAARMAEVATGQTWKQLFEARVRNKCSMGTAEYNPASIPITGNPNQPNAGHGLMVSQNAYSNFMQMIRNGGTFGLNTVVSPSILAELWTPQNGGSFTTWGFGMIRNESGNEPTSESAKGCYAWVNRSKGFSAVLFTQDDYSSTIAINNGLRSLVRSLL